MIKCVAVPIALASIQPVITLHPHRETLAKEPGMTEQARGEGDSLVQQTSMTHLSNDTMHASLTSRK